MSISIPGYYTANVAKKLKEKLEGQTYMNLLSVQRISMKILSVGGETPFIFLPMNTENLFLVMKTTSLTTLLFSIPCILISESTLKTR